jgi:methyltransferase (TIGR00027 family)
VADEQVVPEADQTAVRVALWRALHLEVDGQPPVLADPVELRLAGPADGWRERPDMDPVFTRGFRAAIVARARFIEDLVTAAVDDGVGQYVLLGAGLDTFAQRRPEYAGRLRVFEVDQPAPQAWKRRRLTDLGTASRSGCGWSRSTSRRARPGGTCWPRPGSPPPRPRWWPRPGSACT